MKQALRILAFLLIANPYILPSSVVGATLEYYYGPAGRLRATVSETGETTIYTYDPVGNLLYVTKETFIEAPPVLQSIDPGVLFIGSTTLVAIAGQNLLTTKKIVTGNPFVSMEIAEVSDTRIAAHVTVSSEANAGPVGLTITTQYGSASIETTLTRSQLTLGPGLLALTPGAGGAITATMYPPPGEAATIQITNSGPFVVSAPQSVTIPAAGTAVFNVHALGEGIASISSGVTTTTVYVTSSVYSPVPGEQLTPASGPVSVYIDRPSPVVTTSSVPVSAYREPPAGESLARSMPFSVGIDSPGGISMTQSVPFSVYVESPSGGSEAASPPVSTKILP